MSQFPFDAPPATATEAEATVPDGVTQEKGTDTTVTTPPVDGASPEKKSKRPAIDKKAKAQAEVEKREKQAKSLRERYDAAVKSQEPLKARAEEAEALLAHAKTSPYLAAESGPEQVPGTPDGEPAQA